MAQSPVSFQRSLVALVLLASLLASAPAHAARRSLSSALVTLGPDSWPMVGHDQGQSNADPSGGLSPTAAARLQLRWQRVDASPAIEVGGKLYAITQDSTKNLLALDSVSGSLVQPYTSTGVRSVSYAAPYLYINRGAFNQPSEIRIVNAATDAWLHTASAPQTAGAALFSSFIVAGGRLYTADAFQNGDYVQRQFAFDATDGQLLWSRAGNGLLAPCFASTGLYVTTAGIGNQQSVRLDPAHGTVVTAFPPQLGGWHNAGTRLYATLLGTTTAQPTPTAARIQAYDLSGRLRWSAADAAFGAALPDRVFLFDLNANGTVADVSARRADDGGSLWRLPLPDYGHSWVQMAATAHVVYIQAGNGQIAVADAATGHLLALLLPPFAGTVNATVPGAAGNLLVGNGMVYESVMPLPGVPATKGLLMPGRPTLLAFGASPAVNTGGAQTVQLLRTVAVGHGPNAVAVDAQLGHAFVVNGFDGTMSMLDTHNGTVLKTIALGREGPPDVANGYAVAVDAQIARVIVIDGNGGRVTVVDAASGAIVQHAPTVVRGLGGVSVDQQTHRAFIASLFGNTVSVLDTSRGTILGTTAVGTHPDSLAVDAQSGRVFVAAQDGTVSMLNASTGALLRTVHAARGELGCTTCAGNLVIGGSAGHVLYFTPAGTIMLLSAATGAVEHTSSAGWTAQAAVVDPPTNTITTLDRGPTFFDYGVHLVDAGSGTVLRTVASGNQGGYPYSAIALDAEANRVFVTDMSQNQVLIADARGGHLLQTIPVAASPVAVAVDEQAGRALVVSAGVPSASGSVSLLSIAGSQ